MTIRLVPESPFVPPPGQIEQGRNSIIIDILQIPAKIAPQVKPKWEHHKEIHAESAQPTYDVKVEIYPERIYEAYTGRGISKLRLTSPRTRA
ncbi:MAG TPA: hypothetical protein VJA26_17520 [Gammaproteobacteria bacterium]|nr:hypothetical protein [Gammaproteobacteria bacterium]